MKKIIVATLILFTPFISLAYADEAAHIKLQVGQDGYVTLNVPKQYIGPSKLELAQEVIKAKGPVKMIPLFFIYPGFEVAKEGARWKMSDEEKAQEVLLIVQGGRGDKHGLNSAVYWRLQFYNKDKNCRGEEYPELKYGMHRYKRFGDCKAAKKEHYEDIYFYDAPGNSEDDVMIECPPPIAKRATEKCRIYMNVDEMGLVTTNFSVPQGFLPNWREVVDDYKHFITAFYADEISKMKKPTPLSKGRMKEIQDPAAERWKP